MGLYPIDCAVCKKPFMWFSGCLDQRCSDCQNTIKKEEPTKMKKAELEKEILELKEKVKLLEARPICYGHFCGCNHFNYPINPSYPWYTVTSGTGNPPPNPTVIS